MYKIELILSLRYDGIMKCEYLYIKDQITSVLKLYEFLLMVACKDINVHLETWRQHVYDFLHTAKTE